MKGDLIVVIVGFLILATVVVLALVRFDSIKAEDRRACEAAGGQQVTTGRERYVCLKKGTVMDAERLRRER